MRENKPKYIQITLDYDGMTQEENWYIMVARHAPTKHFWGSFSKTPSI